MSFRLLPGLLLVPAVFTAALSASPPDRPNYNALSAAARSAAARPLDTGHEGLIKRGTTPRMEPRLGVPTFLWAPDGRMPSSLPSARAGAGIGPEQAARAHLEDYAPLYRLGPADVAAARVREVHDTGRGAIIVSFAQDVGGVEVFRDELRLSMNRDLSLLAISGYLTPPEPVASTFLLGPAEALAAGLTDLTGEAASFQDFRPTGHRQGRYDRYRLTPSAEAELSLLGLEPARVRKVFFHLPEGLEPAYSMDLNIGSPDSTESVYYTYVVSALDGRVLFRKNLTAADAYTYRVWADPAGDHFPMDGPQGNDPSPHPTALPDGYQAPFVAPVLITLQNGPLSTNDPWLPPSATQTVGNNVDAYADLASPDGFTSGDLRATTTSASTFDRTYDTALNPVSTSQRMAAVTQLFYVNNFLHDWYYDAGFDEAAGNAQSNNYGRGGLGLDHLRAEAQDYSGRNNANMATPPDGSRPIMQMYVFDGIGLSSLDVLAPASIAGSYTVGIAQFGPQAFDVTGDIVLVNDGSGTLTDGCEAPFVNGGSLLGKIALIDRGTCNFTVKVENAESHGAIAVIIANNTAGVIDMGGTAAIGIGSLMISQADGSAIKAELGTGVNARVVREGTVDRDGTIDNQIVVHEWGHYISNRLVGNAFGLDTNMAAGLGEGWADFHALLNMVRPEDALLASNVDYSGAYAVASYAVSGGSNNGYYFGIRRAPYSTDFAINPMTFKHIANGQPLPAGAPLAFGQDGSNNAESHNTGEIWANMLWECYASLLRDTLGPAPRLSFTQAQQRMRDYLVAGYKMTPNSPTLLEARDAVLAAALANDVADYELFYQAFAKRGAGIGAVAPDRFSSTNQGVVESYVVGGDLVLASAELTDDVATNCLPDGTLDTGETGTLTLTLANTGSATLSSTTGMVTTTHPGVSFPAGGMLGFPPVAPLGTTTTTVPVSLSGVTGIEALDLHVQFDDPGLAVAGPRVADLLARGNADSLPGQSSSDDVESETVAWTPGFNPSLDTSSPWHRIQDATLNHSWLGPDTAAVSDQYLLSPDLQVAATGDFVITFDHRYDFEATGTTYYDGGVIEISTTGGATWSDIGLQASPGYVGLITAGGSNPLQGRPAFGGLSPGYPAMQPVTINLGTTFAGQTVIVRFRIGTDLFVGDTGWEFDNIAFANITNTPFSVLVPHDPQCDADIDGTFDAADCAPMDNTLWSAPSEPRDLLLGGTGTTSLDWSSPLDAGGTGSPLFDVVRSDGSVDFSTGTCLETGGSDLTASDPQTPGVIFYYLVGASNACGRSFGPDSGGGPRNVAACP